MPIEHVLIISGCIVAVAFLYSSVGHAGASGYIAVLTLFNLAPATIKPTALVLNICVSILAGIQFHRAGHFSWRLFWPFAALSIPMAYVGGYANLPTRVFQVMVGIILLFSAIRFLFPDRIESGGTPPAKGVALPIGAALGLVAGLTGTGGGIFLTPLLLLKRWASTKAAAGVSAVFILANSLSGLLGNLGKTRHLPAPTMAFVAAAILGGLAGSYLGSRKFDHVTIKRLLAVVLLIAGAKLILSR